LYQPCLVYICYNFLHFHYSENNSCIWNRYSLYQNKTYSISWVSCHPIIRDNFFLICMNEGKKVPTRLTMGFNSDRWVISSTSSQITSESTTTPYLIQNFSTLILLTRYIFSRVFVYIQELFWWMLLFWNIWRSLNMHLPIKQFACISITKDTKPYASFTVKYAFILCNIPCYYMIIRKLLFFIEVTQLLKWLYA